MKLNEKVKHVTCGIVVGAMLTTTFPAAAAQMTKNISATYNNIKIIVDGQQVNTGSDREPFIYNGTTYLPIRAVGEAVGKKVTWDGKTNTVYLGDNPVSDNAQYLVDVCPPYEGGSIYDVKVAGKSYLDAITVRSSYPALFNLDAKYSLLEFYLGHKDGYNGVRTYNFYVDGVLVDTIILEKDSLPVHGYIPLNNGLQLKIESDDVWGNSALVNCTVK